MDIKEGVRLKIVLRGVPSMERGGSLYADLWFLREGRFQVLEVGTYGFWIGEDGVGTTQVRLPPGRYTIRALASIDRRCEADVQLIAGRTAEVHLDY